jgi:hypothetical protein
MRAGIADNAAERCHFGWNANAKEVEGCLYQDGYSQNKALLYHQNGGTVRQQMPEDNAPIARRAYRAFVIAGIPQGRRPEFQGGGLLRSHGGWVAVALLRRGREAYLGDERILGNSDFVEQVRRDLQKASPPAVRRRPLADLIARVCATTGTHPTALQQGSRRAAVARAREGIAYLALEVEGYTGRTVADVLGVHPPSVYRAAQRGRAAHRQWDRMIKPQGE